MSRGRAWRDCNVASVGRLVHDEHFGTAHSRACSKADPLVVCGCLDLEKDVPTARVCCVLWDVDLITHVAIALLRELCEGSRACSKLVCYAPTRECNDV